MSRDIKFRYRIQVGESVVTEIVSLEELESGDIKPAGKVLSRDEWTGLTDRDGALIFEGDVLTDYDILGKILYQEAYQNRKWIVEFGESYSEIPTRFKKDIQPVGGPTEYETVKADFAMCYLIRAVSQPRTSYALTNDWVSILKVIGDIHQNPELLKRGAAS